jgi:hypothetical protein
MVFLIQNTRSRTRAALQLKLDEFIRSMSGAHNVMLALEYLSLEESETFCTHYEKLAVTACGKLRRGQADTSSHAITIWIASSFDRSRFVVSSISSRTIPLLLLIRAEDSSYCLADKSFQSEQFWSAFIQPKVQHDCVA